MKRGIFIATSVVVLFVFGLAVAGASENIRLFVGGKEVYSDVPPQIINGRVMVPVRFVAEALGCTVTWIDMANAVSISKEGPQPPNKEHPLIVGPEHFSEVINESLSLIKEKDTDTYYWLIANIEKVVYEENPASDRYAARINIENRTCYVNKNDFNGVVNGGSKRENALIYLGVLAHESAHAHIRYAGINKFLADEEEEKLCNIVAYKVLTEVETDTSSIPLRLFKD